MKKILLFLFFISFFYNCAVGVSHNEQLVDSLSKICKIEDFQDLKAALKDFKKLNSKNKDYIVFNIPDDAKTDSVNDSTIQAIAKNIDQSDTYTIGAFEKVLSSVSSLMKCKIIIIDTLIGDLENDIEGWSFEHSLSDLQKALIIESASQDSETLLHYFFNKFTFGVYDHNNIIMILLHSFSEKNKNIINSDEFKKKCNSFKEHWFYKETLILDRVIKVLSQYNAIDYEWWPILIKKAFDEKLFSSAACLIKHAIQLHDPSDDSYNLNNLLLNIAQLPMNNHSRYLFSLLSNKIAWIDGKNNKVAQLLFQAIDGKSCARHYYIKNHDQECLLKKTIKDSDLENILEFMRLDMNKEQYEKILYHEATLQAFFHLVERNKKFPKKDNESFVYWFINNYHNKPPQNWLSMLEIICKDDIKKLPNIVVKLANLTHDCGMWHIWFNKEITAILEKNIPPHHYKIIVKNREASLHNKIFYNYVNYFSCDRLPSIKELQETKNKKNKQFALSDLQKINLNQFPTYYIKLGHNSFDTLIQALKKMTCALQSFSDDELKTVMNSKSFDNLYSKLLFLDFIGMPLRVEVLKSIMNYLNNPIKNPLTEYMPISDIEAQALAYCYSNTVFFTKNNMPIVNPNIDIRYYVQIYDKACSLQLIENFSIDLLGDFFSYGVAFQGSVKLYYFLDFFKNLIKTDSNHPVHDTFKKGIIKCLELLLNKNNDPRKNQNQKFVKRFLDIIELSGCSTLYSNEEYALNFLTDLLQNPDYCSAINLQKWSNDFMRNVVPKLTVFPAHIIEELKNGLEERCGLKTKFIKNTSSTIKKQTDKNKIYYELNKYHNKNPNIKKPVIIKNYSRYSKESLILIKHYIALKMQKINENLTIINDEFSPQRRDDWNYLGINPDKKLNSYARVANPATQKLLAELNYLDNALQNLSTHATNPRLDKEHLSPLISGLDL